MRRNVWLSARTSVGVDQILCVAVADVEEKARLVQVHELGVIIHTVKHLWVDWLCNGCMEVVGPITVMKTYMHGVRGSIEVEHVPEDVALRSVREPECGQVVALLLRPSRGGAVATVHVLFRRGKWRRCLICRGSSQSKQTPQIERPVPRLAGDVAQSGILCLILRGGEI